MVLHKSTEDLPTPTLALMIFITATPTASDGNRKKKPSISSRNSPDPGHAVLPTVYDHLFFFTEKYGSTKFHFKYL